MKRLLVMLLSLSLLACVPTPTEEAIVNKADSVLTDAVSQPKAETYRLEAPARWEETVSMKNLSIVIDADVVVPQGDAYPIQTIRRHAFTGEDVLNLLNACFEGPFMLRENRYSMTEVEEDIRLVLRGNWIDWDETTGEVQWEPLTEDTEELIELREKMAQCPAEDTFVPLTADAIAPSGETLAILAGNGQLLYVGFRSTGISVQTVRIGDMQDENTVWQGGMIGEKWHTTLDHITVSEAEASRIGEDALTRAGLSDQFGIALLTNGRLVRPTVDAPYYEVPSEGYILRIARTGGGYIPFPQGSGYYSEDAYSALYQSTTEDEYAQRWSMDWMELYVSDKGIEAVGWYEPNEFVMEANENVHLLPFDEIQSRIRDDLRYSYAWTDDGNRGITELHVCKIVLSCTIARIPNDPQEAMLMPVWVVVYNDNRSEKAHSHEKLMLISAIDGSYVHVAQ